MKLFQTTQTALKNRVSWTVYYLLRVYLQDLTRGYYKITSIGKNENQLNKTINTKFYRCTWLFFSKKGSICLYFF